MNFRLGCLARRFLATCPMLFLLTAARTSVAPLPETIVPLPVEGQEIGVVRTVKAGDVVLKAKVLDTEAVTLEAPVSVSIAKFSQDIAVGTKLDPVLAPDKTLQLTGSNGRIYCGEDQQARSKFVAAMIGNWGSKFETVVRFCFVDSDGDSKLDRVFLAGARAPEFQKAIEIPPTPFALKTMQDDDRGGELQLVVHKFHEKSNKVTLKLKQFRDGKEEIFSYILTINNGAARQTYPDFKTNPGKVPYPAYFNDVLGASVGVMRVDPAKGEADIKVSRLIEPQLFKPVVIQVQYVYIYY